MEITEHIHLYLIPNFDCQNDEFCKCSLIQFISIFCVCSFNFCRLCDFLFLEGLILRISVKNLDSHFERICLSSHVERKLFSQKRNIQCSFAAVRVSLDSHLTKDSTCLHEILIFTPWLLFAW